MQPLSSETLVSFVSDVKKVSSETLPEFPKPTVHEQAKTLKLGIKVKELPLSIKDYQQYLQHAEGGFLQRLAGFFKQAFNRVLILLHLRKTPEIKPEELDMRLMAEMIRPNADTAQVEMGDLLGYTKKTWLLSGGDPAFGKTLEKGEKIAKEVSRLNGKEEITSNDKGMLKLVEGIKKDIKALKTDESALIPLKWYVDGKESVGFLEVKKLAGAEYDLRLISMESEHKNYWAGDEALANAKEKRSPILKFEKVSQGDLESIIRPMVEMQIKPPKQEPLVKGAAAKLLSKIGMDENALKLPERKSFDPLTVMLTYLDKKPVADDSIRMDVRGDSRPFKTFLAYLKAKDPAHYHENKMKLETQAFFDLVERNSEAIVKNSEFRKMTYEAAEKLLRELTIKSTLEDADYDIIINLEKVIDGITDIERSQRSLDLPKIKTRDFEEELVLPEAVKVPEARLFTPSKTPKAELNLSLLELNDIKTVGVHQALAPALENIETLFKEKRYVEVETAIDFVVARLPLPDVENIDWKGSQEQLFRLGELQFNAIAFQGGDATAERLLTHVTLMACLNHAAGDVKDYVFFPREAITGLTCNYWVRLRSPEQLARAKFLSQYFDDRKDWNGTQFLVDRYRAKDKHINNAANYSWQRGRKLWDVYLEEMDPNTSRVSPYFPMMRQLQMYGEVLGSNFEKIDNSSKLEMALSLTPSLLGLQHGLMNLIRSPVSDIKAALQKEGEKGRELKFVMEKSGRIVLGNSGMTYYDGRNQYVHRNEHHKARLGKVDPEFHEKLWAFRVEDGMSYDPSRAHYPQNILNHAANQNEAEIYACCTYKNKLQHLLTYLMAHPERFDDPSIRTHLNHLLYEVDEINSGEVGPAKFFDGDQQKLDIFVQQMEALYQISHATGQNERSLYLLSVLNTLQRFSDTKRVDVPQEIDRLEHKFASPDDVRGVHLLRLVNTYERMEKGEFRLRENDPQLTDLIRGAFVVGKTAPSESYKDPVQEEKVERMIRLMNPMIQKKLANDQDHVWLKGLLKALEIPYDDKTAIQGEYPFLEVGGHNIDFTTAKIGRDGKFSTTLPRSVRNLPYMGDLFTDSQMEKGVEIEKRTNKDGETVELYTFRSRPEMRVVVEEGKTPVIQMKGKGKEWAQYIPFTGEEVKWPNEVKDLIRGYNVFRNKENQLTAIDPKTNEEVYRIAIEKDKTSLYLQKVVRVKDGLELMNLQEGQHLGSLTAFEKASHIHMWGKNGVVNEIEFSRHLAQDGQTLRFTVKQIANSSRKVLESVNYPDYFLYVDPGTLSSAVKGESDPHILPPFFKGYFLLRHKEKVGDQKILMPNLDMTRSEQGAALGQGFAPHFEFKKLPEGSDPVVCHELKVDYVQNELKPKNPDQALFIAYITFASAGFGKDTGKGNYARAEEALKRAAVSGAIGQGQIDLYQKISEWQDDSPRGTLFKLHAKVQCEKARLRDETKRGEKEFVDAICEMQTLWTKHQLHKKEGRLEETLSSQEEADYQNILNLTFLGFAPLTPAEAKQFTPAEPQANIQLDALPPSSVIAQYVFAFGTKGVYSTNDLALRADEAFSKGFLDLYNEVRLLSPTSKEFKDVYARIKVSQPVNPTAISGKAYLMAMCQQQQESHKSFPEIKLPYFKFTRIKDMVKGKGNFEKLDKTLDAISKDSNKDKKELKKEAEDTAVRSGWERGVPGHVLKDEEAKNIETLIRQHHTKEALKGKKIQDLSRRSQENSETIAKVAPYKGETEPLNEGEAAPLLTGKWSSCFKDVGMKPKSPALEGSERLKARLQDSHDPLMRKYGEDLEAWHKRGGVEDFTVDVQALRQYRSDSKGLRGEINRMDDKLKEAQITLASRFNKVPGSTEVPLSLQGVFLEDSWKGEGKELYAEYLDSMVQLRFLNRVAEAIDTLPDNPTEQQTRELYQLLDSKRYYDVKQMDNELARALLLIEFASGFNLRENQVDTIKGMLSGTNSLKQLGMGGGKSSIILPILLKTKAMQGSLSMGIIPEWLFEIVGSDLDKISKEAFGQEFYHLHFDRSTPITEDNLLDILVSCQEAYLNKGSVLTTKTSLLSLRNRFIELNEMVSQTDDPVRKESLEKACVNLAKILTLIHSRGDAVADELDTILDIRKMLVYGLGDTKHIEPELYETGVEVYRTILTRPELSRYATMLKRNEQIYFTPQDIAKIQEGVAKGLYEAHLKDKGISFKEFHAYLTEKDPDVPNLREFFSTMEESDPLLKKLSYARPFVMDTLNTTLQKSVDVHYGRLGENTVPYLANNKPSRAEYGDTFERIAFLTQDYLQKGISPDQTKAMLDKVMAAAQNEIREEQLETGRIMLLEDTVALKNFQEKFPGVNIFKAFKDPQVRQQLTDKINSNHNTILEFLENWVMPEQKLAATQISSNAHNLVEMLDRFSGFTGTPWNIDTLHQDLSREGVEDVGTDGRSLDILAKAFEKGTLKIRTVDIDPDKPLDSLMAMPEFSDYHSLIDAGYYLRGVNNEEAATLLAEKLNKPCVYVTQDNEKRVKRSDGSEQALEAVTLAPDERVTYYDQAHTIGTDIPHSKNAVAIVTISEKMYIKDLLQSVWRLRQLDRGQNVHFVLSKEVEQLIKDRRAPGSKTGAVDLEEIIAFAIENQSDRAKDDNLRGQRQMINGVIPDAAFWGLAEGWAKGDTSMGEAFKEYRDIFINDTTSNAEGARKPKKLEDTSDTLEKMRREKLKMAEEVPEAAQALERLDLLAADKLPEKMVDSTFSTEGTEVEVEREQEREQEQERMRELESEMTVGSPKDRRRDVFLTSIHNLVGELFLMPSVGDYAPELDPRKEIFVSPNILDNSEDRDAVRTQIVDAFRHHEWDRERFLRTYYMSIPPTEIAHECARYADKKSAFIKDIDIPNKEAVRKDLLRGKRLEMGYVAIITDMQTGKKNAVCLDVLEYDVNLKHLLKDFDGRNALTVYDIRGVNGPMRLHQNIGIAPPTEEDADLLVRVKLLNHQTNFASKAEVDALKKLPEGTKKFFEDQLLLPQDRGQWKGSLLERILK